MKLTDKTKEEFEKWYLQDYISIMDNQMVYAPDTVLTIFHEKKLEEQIGVLILYFDSVDIQITIYCWDNNKYSLTILLDGRYLKIYKERFDSREQAWTQAVEKALEIREEQLNQ